MREFWISVRMTIVLTLLLGIIYPVAMVIVGHVVFSHQAEGSLIARNGSIAGSELIGQNFSSSAYFHSRPSAAGSNGYDATSSSGSNLGPTNKSFIDSVHKRLKDTAESEGVSAAKIPIDLITASGSGLDPEISPAAADVQIARVARSRGLSVDTVSHLVEDNTRGRWLGLFGEPGVNVLKLNLALDDLKASSK